MNVSFELLFKESNHDFGNINILSRLSVVFDGVSDEVVGGSIIIVSRLWALLSQNNMRTVNIRVLIYVCILVLNFDVKVPNYIFLDLIFDFIDWSKLVEIVHDDGLLLILE